MTGPADLSDDELVAHALAVHLLAGDDREVYDGCVAELQHRGTAGIRDRATDLLGDARPQARALGADVLGRLGEADGSPFASTSVPRLLALLGGGEADPLVIDSTAAALGFLGDEAALEPLLALVDHPSFRVRGSVARALPSLVGEGAVLDARDPVLRALLELTTDPDAEVRNWATFGLGSRLAADGPEVRAALQARLLDGDDDTHAEALIGLVRRDVPGLVSAIQADLEAEAVGRLAVEAAREAADPALRPALEGLVGWWDVDVDLLEAALVACAPDART
ncbi:HEAT repeat domain-containing protein [Aquihabitans sp. G128]|uniref:HEAT repeat domain-containing protein n=1 Tax=Aquihabitans sp. G128 TaxID=2849779 RepID=UPI001C226DF9|nr:HEAT repeat domain-containing protein [Aquihabitans sp. G128]QXC62131.1 HEAT repeat domain-containing protein [Aquihabitans sp. G128]